MNREFDVAQPNRAWVTGVKAIWASRWYWIYLAAVMDLCSRRVVGWETSDTNDTALAVAATSKDVLARGNPKGVIHHTDRESPYASKALRELLSENHFIQSMSRKGDCWDNAVADSFFSTIECKMLSMTEVRDEEDAHRKLSESIAFYNAERMHSTIGYMSPISYELNCAAGDDSAA